MSTSFSEYRHSLRFQLTAALLAVLTLALGIAMFGIWTFERRHFIEMASDTARRGGQLIEKSLSEAMLANDRPAVQKAVKDLATIYVPPARISIIDPTGRVAVSSDSQMLGETFDRFSAPSCVVCHTRQGLRPQKEDIMIDGPAGPLLRSVIKVRNRPECNRCHPATRKILGVLMYDSYFSKTYELLRAMFVRMLLTGLATFLAISLVLFLAIDRLIHRPTAKLMEGFVQVGRGNYDFWVDEESSNEFIYMADQFNVMSRAIGRFIREIKENNRETAILYAIVREVSETIEWERLKMIVLELVHDIFKAEQGSLVLPDRQKNRFDITWRDGETKRPGHLVYRPGKDVLELTSVRGADLLAGEDETAGVPRFLDAYERLLVPLYYRQ